MLFRGEKLRKLRKNKGISLTQASDMLGVLPSYLSAVESGRKKNLRQETVEKICKVFNIHKNYFYIDDAMLLTDVYDDLPDDLRAYMIDQENMPYIKLSREIKNAGITPERLAQLIAIIKEHK